MHIDWEKQAYCIMSLGNKFQTDRVLGSDDATRRYICSLAILCGVHWAKVLTYEYKI